MNPREDPNFTTTPPPPLPAFDSPFASSGLVSTSINDEEEAEVSGGGGDVSAVSNVDEESETNAAKTEVEFPVQIDERLNPYAKLTMLQHGPSVEVGELDSVQSTLVI
ncbi:hypothetical protein HDU67_000603 [Dinochytrium kinnereticum]|nr:hypothetical protein HDU67_000603 [Dinochytrium kinnereticum]